MKIVAPEISRQCEDSEDAVRIRRLPEPFHFYRLSFNSDHLHFGFWPDNSVNLSLEEAQETMFQRLLEHFPDPPARVLDVGCGLGRSAFLLKQKGYQVVAIAPAAEMIAYASEKYGGDHIEFHVAGFPDGEDTGFAAATYDVILFQESLQYLRALPLVFEKCRALLHPKGRLIIGDEICYDPSIKTETAVHRSEDVVTALLENGFRITDHKKIGNNVLPTCDQVIRQFTEKFDQIVGAVCTEDAAERLGFFLKGWKAQKDWYAEQKMGYDIIVAKKDRVSIRTYQDGDEIKILALFNHAFKTGRTAEHWYWKYRDNPFGAFHIAEAVSENGRLAAQ